MELRFRPNVAGILERPDDGRILIAERVDFPGAWQFPQGGVDEGEDLEAAFYREMEEEIGLKPSDYMVLEQRGGYRYTFPAGRTRGGGRFHGQEQTYFRCRLVGDESSIALDGHGHEREFSAFRWIPPEAFDLGWLPEFKRAVYARVLHDFFGVA